MKLSMQEIFNYYRIMCTIGKYSLDDDGELKRCKNGKPKINYACNFFFYDNQNCEELNELTRAYLCGGLTLNPLGDEVDFCEENLLEGDPKHKLNKSQVKAVKVALKNRISFIEGPPGTGKTETILSIVSEILAAGKDVAVVSKNKESINNISEKVHNHNLREEEKNWKRVRESYTKLGNAELRSKWDETQQLKWKNKNFPQGLRVFKFEDDGGQEKAIKACEFLERYPFITCTVQSLKKCFVDGFDYQYDYVIIDEASVCSIDDALLVMSSAKHFVIIGDVNQIAPIFKGYGEYKDKAKILVEEKLLDENDSNNMKCKSPYDLEDEEIDDGMSILKSAQQVFGTNKDNCVMLNEHYRCNPEIISFCNENVYENKLKIKTKKTNNIPIRVRYFEGAYTQRHFYHQKDGSERNRSKHNNKQIDVFIDEELPLLEQKLDKDPNLSCCILTPFRGQVDQIEKRLGENNCTLFKRPGKKDEDGFDRYPILTIHGSQGKEFDIAYILPVDDSSKWDPPWSQGMNMVNVAVSRAKKELVIITSTSMMSQRLQDKLTNGRHTFLESKKERKKSEKRYIQRLIDWTWKRFKGRALDRKDGFGFVPAIRKSVFDYSKYYESNEKKWTNSNLESHHEAAMRHCLKKTKLNWKSQVALKDNTSLNCSLLTENEGNKWAFDFVVYEKKTKRIFLAIEVDGMEHCDDVRDDVKFTDDLKNRCVTQKENGGVVLLGNKLEDGVSLEDLLRGSTFALLRLPTKETDVTNETPAFQFDNLKPKGKKKEAYSNYFTVEDVVKYYKKKSKKMDKNAFIYLK